RSIRRWRRGVTDTSFMRTPSSFDMGPLATGVAFLQDQREQPPRTLLVLRPPGITRHADLLERRVDRKRPAPDPGQHFDRQPVPHHEGEAPVDHDLAEVVGVTDVT